jgi:hypothetical protein
MDDRTRSAVRMAALARIGFGTAMLVLPGLVGRAWIGSSASTRGVRAIVRALGVRDAVIGIGTLVTLDDDRPVSHWLWYAAASDAVDALATMLAAGSIPKRALVSVVAMAGGGAAANIRLAQQVEAQSYDDTVPETV